MLFRSQNAVSWALTPNTERLTLGLFMSVDPSRVVWEFQNSHSAEVTLQTVTCLCFAGLQKSREAWEQPSKSGASKWRFIWLLIRTIPSYLRDCNTIWLAFCKYKCQWNRAGFPAQNTQIGMCTQSECKRRGYEN